MSCWIAAAMRASEPAGRREVPSTDQVTPPCVLLLAAACIWRHMAASATAPRPLSRAIHATQCASTSRSLRCGVIAVGHARAALRDGESRKSPSTLVASVVSAGGPPGNRSRVNCLILQGFWGVLEAAKRLQQRIVGSADTIFRSSICALQIPPQDPRMSRDDPNERDLRATRARSRSDTRARRQDRARYEEARLQVRPPRHPLVGNRRERLDSRRAVRVELLTSGSGREPWGAARRLAAASERWADRVVL